MDGTGGAPAVYDASTQVVQIDMAQDAHQYKTTIAHELGHAWVHWANYPGTGDIFPDYSFRDDLSFGPGEDHCASGASDHSMVSKEHQTAAISEGYAHFLAAVAFNERDEVDCRWKPQGQITWLEGFSGAYEAFSCQGYADGDGGIEYDSYNVRGYDYLGETLGESPDEYTCLDDGETADVATELDWLRFLWDLHSESPYGRDLAAQDILDLLLATNPENWCTPTFAPYGCYHAANSFEWQLTHSPYSDEWDEGIYNGVDE
jgi:hypothetical protein